MGSRRQTVRLHFGQVLKVASDGLLHDVGVAAVLSFFAGLIWDSVHRGRVEVRRRAYLAVAGPEARANIPTRREVVSAQLTDHFSYHWDRNEA